MRRIDTGISSESFLTLPAKHQPRLLLSSLTPSINPLARSLSHVQELVKGECGSATWTVASSTSRAQVPEESRSRPKTTQTQHHYNLMHIVIFFISLSSNKTPQPSPPNATACSTPPHRYHTTQPSSAHPPLLLMQQTYANHHARVSIYTEYKCIQLHPASLTAPPQPAANYQHHS